MVTQRVRVREREDWAAWKNEEEKSEITESGLSFSFPYKQSDSHFCVFHKVLEVCPTIFTCLPFHIHKKEPELLTMDENWGLEIAEW